MTLLFYAPYGAHRQIFAGVFERHRRSVRRDNGVGVSADGGVRHRLVVVYFVLFCKFANVNDR